MKVGDRVNFLNGEIVSIVLFLIGIYGLIARRNILKSIISLGIMQSALILFFLSIRFNSSSHPPIAEEGGHMIMADPLPQTLMITTIVIGVAVTAVALTMFMTLYHSYGTTNWSKVVKKRGENQ